MASNKGKTSHSGAHGTARETITSRNKIRRAKKQAARWVKLRAPERVARLNVARDLRRQARRKAKAPKQSVQNNHEKEIKIQIGTAQAVLSQSN